MSEQSAGPLRADETSPTTVEDDGAAASGHASVPPAESAAELPAELPAAPVGPALVWLLGALVVGLAVRAVYALHLGEVVGEWEADGFVSFWEGRPWEAANRVRAPGVPWLLGRLGEVLELTTVLQVRLLCIGLSLVALLAVFDAARAVARRTGMSRPSAWRACAWITGVWAVFPSLVGASVSPTPELLVGGAAALLVGSAARYGEGPGIASWLGVALAGGIFVVLGGVVAAAALVVGLVVYLVPVPRVGTALAMVGAVAIALGTGYVAQAGREPARRAWVPDTAPFYAWIALADEGGHPPREQVPIDADDRARAVLVRAGEALAVSDLLAVGRRLHGRVVFDLLGPGRFDRITAPPPPLPGPDPPPADAEPADERPVVAVGLLDLIVRGGLLLFAMTVVGLVRRSQVSTWPRAALVVGSLVWLVLLAVGAVGPWALAPYDTVLLAVAGAGVAGTDPRRAWTRRIGFLVGGGLLCTLLLTGGWRHAPLSRWATDLTHWRAEGRLLVNVLDGPGPQGALQEVGAATMLMQFNAPFLRLPEASLRHALEATRQDPTSETAGSALVQAYVENGLYEDAARLAEDIHAASGGTSVPARVQLEWVQDVQRQARAVPVR